MAYEGAKAAGEGGTEETNEASFAGHSEHLLLTRGVLRGLPFRRRILPRRLLAGVGSGKTLTFEVAGPGAAVEILPVVAGGGVGKGLEEGDGRWIGGAC